MPVTDDVAAGEHGQIRVYEVTLPPAEAAKLTDGEAEGLARALGVGKVDPGGVEIVDTSALTGVGLDGYLVDGLGADEAAIESDRSRLSALKGPVAVVRSRAFEGEAARIETTDALIPLGAYPEASAEPVRQRFPVDGELEAPAAHGAAGPADDPAPSGRGLPTWAPVAAIAILLVVVLVLAF